MTIKKLLLCLGILSIFIAGCSQIVGETPPIVNEWVVDVDSLNMDNGKDSIFFRAIFLVDGSFMFYENLEDTVPVFTGDWEYSANSDSTGTLVISSLIIKFPDGSTANSLSKPVSTSVSFNNDQMLLSNPPVGMFSNYTRALSQAEVYEKFKKETEAKANTLSIETENNKFDNGALDPTELLEEKINEGYRLLESDLEFVNKEIIKDTTYFITDNGDSLINHDIYIYSPIGANGVIFVIDATSGKVYQRNGKNINGHIIQNQLSIMNKNQ